MNINREAVFFFNLLIYIVLYMFFFFMYHRENNFLTLIDRRWTSMHQRYVRFYYSHDFPFLYEQNEIDELTHHFKIGVTSIIK